MKNNTERMRDDREAMEATRRELLEGYSDLAMLDKDSYYQGFEDGMTYQRVHAEYEKGDTELNWPEPTVTKSVPMRQGSAYERPAFQVEDDAEIIARQNSTSDVQWHTQENDNDEEVVSIIANGKNYGTWYTGSNVTQPEDLILHRDLGRLIDIGIQMGRDSVKKQGFDFAIAKDGNMYCAFTKDFVNLQESDCFAFGETPEIALSSLLSPHCQHKWDYVVHSNRQTGDFICQICSEICCERPGRGHAFNCPLADAEICECGHEKDKHSHGLWCGQWHNNDCPCTIFRPVEPASDADGLLPCPFCGSKPEVAYTNESDDIGLKIEAPEVMCSNVDCILYEHWMDDDVWQTRTSQPQGEVEK